MIRNALLAPLARAVRGAVRGGALEGPAEYALYLLGWLAWPLDGLLRLPALAREATVGGEPRSIRVVGAALVRSGAAPDPALERVRRLLDEAGAVLRGIEVEVIVESVAARSWPEDVAPPACGPRALLGRFFPWASARAGEAPCLTVDVVEDLGPLAGCAVPGADWVVGDGRTDGTTVAHELGHLADLWIHHADPDNLMTDRPGGGHARITPAQAAMIRTSRFAVRSVVDRGGEPDRDRRRIVHGADRRVDAGGQP